MTKESSAASGQASETVRVAKISALQAVVVALIAGAAGVASTAGLHYLERSRELAQKDQEFADLKASSQTEIDSLKQQLQRSTPVSSLLRTTTTLTQDRCYDVVTAALQSALPNATNLSASGREPTDAGGRAGLGGFSVRFICDPAAKLLVVSVAGLGAKSETDRIAASIVAQMHR